MKKSSVSDTIPGDDVQRASWKLTYNRFIPKEEGLRESLCTLGNGYFGTRGAALESFASEVHYPGTYIAGVYNKLATHLAGRTVHNEDFVNCTNWLPLTFKISDSEWFLPSKKNLLSYQQELDMRCGTLTRRMRVKDRYGRITGIESTVLIHMDEPHRMAIRYIVKPENYTAMITVRSGLDGAVLNTGVQRYCQLNNKHLKPWGMGTFARNGIYLTVKTNQSDIYVTQAANLHIFHREYQLAARCQKVMREHKRIFQEYAFQAEKQESYCIEKICALFTSRDRGIDNHVSSAIGTARTSPHFSALLKTHCQVWERLWDRFDITIQGDAFTQLVLRLHAFHLLQTASSHNILIDAGLPARGLHGEAYRGHVFWDETFVLPFFNNHKPKISKALLMYRYRRLPRARVYAKRNGYRGAMFPWQSGSTGDEETQMVHLNPLSGKWGPDYSYRQRHISFAIAYNVWRYWQRTRDWDFFVSYGAEILLSIAQFAASLVVFDARDKRYHTEGIMGPDEFHEKQPDSLRPGLRDNAYSNVMIAWVLMRAREAFALLPKQQKEKYFKKLGIDADELKRWDDISRKINVIFNKNGIISQFENYFSLKEINFKEYIRKYKSVERMDRILKAEGKSPNDYKVAKQADVLMLFYLLSDEELQEIFFRLKYAYDPHLLKRNYDYYIQRTSHGSTLSKVVHCYLAHLLGRKREAWKWFMEVLKSDIYDTQGGTTPEGVHCGVMGGSLSIVIRGFLGVLTLRDRIRIQPKLPDKISSIKTVLRYKKMFVTLTVSRKKIILFIKGIGLAECPLPFEISGKLYHVVCGREYTIPYEAIIF